MLRARTVVSGCGGPFPCVLFFLFVAAQRPVLTRRAPPRRLYALAPRYVCGVFVCNLQPALPTFLLFSLRFYVRPHRCPYLGHPGADTSVCAVGCMQESSVLRHMWISCKGHGLDASWAFHSWAISSTGEALCAMSFWGNLAGWSVLLHTGMGQRRPRM
ncbi:hypothetical protein FB451DRAFT_1557168 [Mycena latifolia]|nr:hypothetical protein FB451DRAFT_1557168 [Mycena latifolia]